MRRLSGSRPLSLLAVALLLSGCGGDGPTDPRDDDGGVEASVTVTPGEATLNARDATHTFSAEVTGGDASATWTSTDPDVASIDEGGTATAVADGVTEIVATISTDADTATLTVAIEVAEIVVSPQEATAQAGGDTVQLEAESRDANGHPVESADIEWGSADETIASVDANGAVTGHQPGETDVHASADGVADSTRIVVEDPPGNDAPVTSIDAPGDGSTFTAGETIGFRGTATDVEDGTLTGGALEWSSSLDGVFGTGEQVETSVLSEGTHVITLVATDSEGATGEDEIGVTVETPEINLAVERLDVDGRGVLTSETLELGGMVHNSGTHEAGPFDWTLRVDGTVVASDRISGVAAGDSVAIPSQTGIGPYSAGEHAIELELDTGGEIDELDESDNLAADRFIAYPAGEVVIELDYLSSVTSSQQAAFEAAADRWSAIVTADLPDVPFSEPVDFEFCAEGAGERSDPVDDLLIFVTVDSIDGSGGTLGQAGPCFAWFNEEDEINTVIAGAMTFDEDDLAQIESDGLLDAVILHEMGHVLGIGSLWSAHDLVAGAGTADPVYTGTTGRDGFLAVGGDGYAGTPVPAENDGQTGTRDVHWRESVFDDELMTGFVNFGDNPLSVVSIRGLRDQFYPTDPAEADAYQLPSSSLRMGTSGGIHLRDDVLRLPIRGIGPDGRRRWVR